MRAPIQFRHDGLTCSLIGQTTGTATWIGLQEDKNDLVQAGFAHIYYGGSSGHYCRFYEALPAAPYYYDCDNSDDQVDGDYVFFEIHEYGDAPNIKYRIKDCGQSNPSYADAYCTTMNDSTPVYPTASSYDLEEAQYGSTCVQWIMGDGSNPDNIGNGTDGIQNQPDESGAWDDKTIYEVAGTNSCDSYEDNLPHLTAVTIDDRRNTS